MDYYEALTGILLALPFILLGLALIAASRNAAAFHALKLTDYSSATPTAWRRTARLAGASITAIALFSVAAGLSLGIAWQALILTIGVLVLQAVIPAYAIRQAEVAQLSEPPLDEEWEPVPTPGIVDKAILLIVTAATLYAATKTLLLQAPIHIKALPLVLASLQLYMTLSILRGSPPIPPHSASRTGRISWLGLQVINGILAIIIYLIIA